MKEHNDSSCHRNLPSSYDSGAQVRYRGCSLTDRLKVRATRPPAQGRGTKSVPRQGHNTPLPLKRSPPASFKRLLGGALAPRCPRLVQFRLCHAQRLRWRLSGQLQALSGGEHGTAHRDITCERLEAEGWAVHVEVGAFHSPAHEIRLVPEPCTAGVTDEVLPPRAVRLGARPPLHGFEVLPVPTHADMQREEAEDDVVFEMEQAFRPGSTSLVDLGAKAKQGLDACEGPNSHP